MSGLHRFFGEEPPTTQTCPRCRRSTFESIEQVEPSMLKVKQCHSCEGHGIVTPARAAEIRAEMQAEQQQSDTRREPG